MILVNHLLSLLCYFFLLTGQNDDDSVSDNVTSHRFNYVISEERRKPVQQKPKTLHALSYQTGSHLPPLPPRPPPPQPPQFPSHFKQFLKLKQFTKNAIRRLKK